MKSILAVILFISMECYGQKPSITDFIRRNRIYYESVSAFNFEKEINSEGYSSRGIWSENWITHIPAENHVLILKKVEINLEFPDTSVELHAYRSFGQYFTDSCNHDNYQILSSYDLPFDNLFLVGYIKSRKMPLFISGHVFKDYVWQYFKKSGFTATNITSFLKFKCYNMDLVSLKYEYKKHRKYYFTAKARNKDLVSDYEVVFDEKKPDNPTIFSGKRMIPL